MKRAAMLGAWVLCLTVPLVFTAPASTISRVDETAALAVTLGPGSYFLGPESLVVTGNDTLHVTVSCSRRLDPPRDTRVIGYTALPDGASFTVVREVPE
ncbi:MAG: hypothetical protein R6V62_06530 [Candidatus Fermentibacteraceae bacterium]